MSKKNLIIFLLIVTTAVVTITGCTKTTTILLDNSTAVTTTVSFSKDLTPLLTTNCAKSGCHNGSISPNLTDANAYNSLINGSFVNTSAPENSEVYLWLTGKRSATMPLGATPNPSNINGIMLAWIKQGAKNN